MDNNFLQDILRRTGINLDLSSMFGGQPADNTQQVPNLQLPNPTVSGAPPSSVADQAAMIKNILMKRFAPSAPSALAPATEQPKGPIELRKSDYSSQVPGREPLRTATRTTPVIATPHSGSGIAAGFIDFLQGLNNVNAQNEQNISQDRETERQNAEKKDYYQWQKEFDINANEQNPQTIFDRDRREAELDLKQQAFDQKLQMDNLRQQILGARLGKIQSGSSGSSSGKTANNSNLNNFELDATAYQDLEKAGVDINLPESTLKKIYVKMNEKEALKKDTATKKFYADGSYVDHSDPQNPKFIKSDKQYSPATYQKAAEAIDSEIGNITFGKKDEELTPDELNRVNEKRAEANLYRGFAKEQLKKGTVKTPAGSSAPGATTPVVDPTKTSRIDSLRQKAGIKK